MTSVPTAFLADHMPAAPAPYVKVYLYGLYLAGQENVQDADLESALHMSKSEIDSAVTYWASRGLMRTSEDGTVHYVIQERSPQVEPHPYASFNLRMGDVLERPPLREELTKAYEWMEQYGFPQEVVLRLIQHCVSAKGPRITFNYIEKTAAAWAAAGVESLEDAEEQIREYVTKTSGAKQVLREMGIYGRLPDRTEMELYSKWTSDWGFLPDGIQRAMKDREFNMQAPFKYLDAILRDYHERGLHRSQEIDNAATQKRSELDEIKEVLREAGLSGPVVREHEKVYRAWRKEGFTLPVILKACGKASSVANKNKRLEQASSILNNWKQRGLLSEKDVLSALAHEQDISTRMREVYNEAGIETPISESDRRLYERYTVQYGMDHEVLMYAANLSVAGNEPKAYFASTLQRWATRGVKTVQEAQKVAKEYDMQKQNRGLKKNAERTYDERPIAPNAAEERALKSIAALEARFGDA